MKNIFTFLFVALSINLFAQTYYAPTTGVLGSYSGGCPIGTNTGTFYDDGGTSDYSPSINNIYRTICPTNPGESIKLTFTSFNMESGIDYIKVANGPAQNSTVFTSAPADAFGWITGNLSASVPFSYTATNSSGCLTVRTKTDGSFEYSGFVATISTVNNGTALASGNSDCNSSTFVCSNSAMNDVSNGPGLSPNDGCGLSCLTGEVYSNWYTFTIKTSGTFDLTIAGGANDYDFALYGPNDNCSNGTPVRCSFAGVTGNTGIGNSASDVSEGTGGDGWVSTMNVTAGQSYQLLINNWSPGVSSFGLTFGGTATLGTEEPVINSATICNGNSATLTASTITSGGTYLWSPGGQTTSSITVSPSSTTPYTCVYTYASCTSSVPGTATVTVNPVVVPSISIASSDADNIICAGTSVTFTATPTNGGSTPSYQWYVGATAVGTNSTTYTTTGLTNGQTVTCAMTSNATCATPATVTSSGITTTVNPVLVPSVSIASSDADNTICAGTSVTFTATPTNGGSTPAYQWYVGATPVGTNSTTYTTTGLTNGQTVTCVLTSNATCASPTTATSTGITTTVNPVLVPSVSIVSSDADNTICAGASVTFTATPTNGGSTPAYQWYVGATPVGTNSTTYTTTGLTNGQTVTCVLISNATCASPTTATSTGITTTVNPVLVPSVSIASSDADNTICAGTSVTFTATPTNGGSIPAYQWYIGATPVGTNSTTYTTTGLTNGQTVTCVLTSNAICASPTTATSSGITTTVNPVLVPSVSIVSSDADNTICAGTSVTFTATPTNGGSSPSYQWYVGATAVGTNSTTYTTTGLTNGQSVTCVLTSNATCATPTTATSTAIVTTVNPVLVSSVSIVSSDLDNSICAGTNVTFTATPTNGGTTPSYQWYLNGNPVGTNSTTYSISSIVNGDAVYCELTSNATCVTTALVNSNTISTAVLTVLIPSVTIISSDADNTICAGTSVTFTATPNNGGSSPTFQWELNGSPVGTNSTTYTTSGLTNGQSVTCILTSNDACASPTTGTSSAIVTTVNPILVPSVGIVSSDADNIICAGETVTFTATPTNGGSTPIYQWYEGTTPVGTNSTTYTTTGLTNGQTVTCEITSNATCATPTNATSSGVTTTVNPVLVPSVSIVSSDADNTICNGTSITFTATPTNGGSTPIYQWYLDGVPVGTNLTTYTTSGLTNGQEVTCEITSNATCASPLTDLSLGIITTVNPILTPDIIISSSDLDNTICAGTSVTFTAIPTNGGSSPSYQWYLDGLPVGTNSTTYTTSGLTNGQSITCDLTSDYVCPSSSTVSSLGITITVNQYPVLNSVNATTVCLGALLPAISGSNVTSNAAYYTGANATGSHYIPGDLLLIPGVTTFYINDSIGSCHDEETFVLTVLDFEDPTFIFNSFCEGTSNGPLGIVTQGGTFSFDAPVSDGASINPTTGILSNVVGGSVYNVQYLTSGTCKDSLVLPIIVNATPVSPTLSNDTTYCFSDTIKAVNVLTNSGGTITWYEDANLTNAVNTGLSYLPNATTSTYYVVETSSSIPACESVESTVTITVHSCEVEIPSAFTPDNDKMNDTWELKYIDVNFPKSVVKIFNRWGNIIYESSAGNYEKTPWDGKLNGDILPIATYYYIIEYNDDTKENSKGIVTIIRN